MEAALIAGSISGFALIIGGIVLIERRLSRLEGRLTNGDYLRCPFYRRKNKEPNNDGGECHE